jgi:DNA recombination protein RmuC
MDINVVVIIVIALIFLVVVVVVSNVQSQNVSGKLGELSELARQIDSTGKEIYSHFKGPQKRGRLGEILLSDLLQEILPASQYELQHTFQDGTRADAVIKLSGGLVVIDSKFLEDYSISEFNNEPLISEQAQKKVAFRVRKHIDAVQKYIKPAEGTLPFALMFIPSEALYYDAVTSNLPGSDGKTLFSYACSQQVFPVGPSVLYPYLMTIALGLKGLYVAAHAHEIIGLIGQLEQDYVDIEEKWDKARRQMSMADYNLAAVYDRMKDLQRQISRITSIQ